MADVVINGTDIVVFMGADAVAHATSHTLGMTMATRETSNKDTGKFNTKAPARLEVTASCDALVVYTDFALMAAAVTDRAPLLVKFGERTAEGTLDDTKFYAEGMFIITSLEMTAGDQENASYSASFEHYSDFALSTEDDLRAFVMSSDATGADNGFVAVFPKSGTAPYTYLWAGAGNAHEATTQSVAGLAPGTYSCTISDDDDGEVEKTITVGGTGA